MLLTPLGPLCRVTHLEPSLLCFQCQTLVVFDYPLLLTGRAPHSAAVPARTRRDETT